MLLEGSTKHTSGSTVHSLGSGPSSVVLSPFPDANPGNRRLPVRSCCMAACLMRHFLEMRLLNEDTRESRSESTSTMAYCSLIDGSGMGSCAYSTPLIPGWPLLMDIKVTQLQYCPVLTYAARNAGNRLAGF